MPSRLTRSTNTSNGMFNATTVIALLLLTNLAIFQLSGFYYQGSNGVSVSSSIREMPSEPMRETRKQAADTSPKASLRRTQLSPFEIPQGKAKALPSIRISEEENKGIDRKIYGGDGDKAHLGGFTEIDLHGISPAVWTYMVEYFGVKSLLDLGCGRGISTSWFYFHGVDVTCAEGSHDAVEKNILPNKDKAVVEHDFSRGPWWPERTVDALWCVEFTEHVERNFIVNYLPAMRKAAYIFVSHSHWGGWHHVEVHDSAWWITKWESLGFKYSDDLTQKVKSIATKESRDKILAPNGKTYIAQHLYTTLQVFINPAVASLPEHAHLLAEHGCFVKRVEKDLIKKDCGDESALPESFKPLQLTDKMYQDWFDLVKSNVKPAD